MGEKCSDKFRLRIRLPRNSRDLLHAANLRHGTHSFTYPPKEGLLKIFSPLKITFCIGVFFGVCKYTVVSNEVGFNGHSVPLDSLLNLGSVTF